MRHDRTVSDGPLTAAVNQSNASSVRLRRNTIIQILLGGFLTVGLLGCSSGEASKPPPSERIADTQIQMSLTSQPPTPSKTTFSQAALAQVSVDVDRALPTGATEADRIAVREAALAFQGAVDAMIDALPAFKPNEVLRLAAPGSADGIFIVSNIRKLANEGYRAFPATVRDRLVKRVTLTSANDATVELCLADNTYFEGPAGPIEQGLTGSVDQATFQKVGGEWQFVERLSQTDLPDGERCTKE